jgi:hypothetical protein
MDTNLELSGREQTLQVKQAGNSQGHPAEKYMKKLHTTYPSRTSQRRDFRAAVKSAQRAMKLKTLHQARAYFITEKP